MIRNFALVAKAVIINKDKALLLHRSKDEMSLTKINESNPWDLPGGSIQFFEKIQDGLEREIKEETKLSVSILKPIAVYDAIRSNLHITVVVYLCEYKTGIATLSEEHDYYKWLTIEEIEQLNVPEWLKKYYKKSFNEYNMINTH